MNIKLVKEFFNELKELLEKHEAHIIMEQFDAESKLSIFLKDVGFIDMFNLTEGEGYIINTPQLERMLNGDIDWDNLEIHEDKFIIDFDAVPSIKLEL